MTWFQSYERVHLSPWSIPLPQIQSWHCKLDEFLHLHLRTCPHLSRSLSFGETCRPSFGVLWGSLIQHFSGGSLVFRQCGTHSNRTDDSLVSCWVLECPQRWKCNTHIGNCSSNSIVLCNKYSEDAEVLFNRSPALYLCWWMSLYYASAVPACSPASSLRRMIQTHVPLLQWALAKDLTRSHFRATNHMLLPPLQGILLIFRARDSKSFLE